MHISGLFILCITLLIGSTLAAPVPTEPSDDLVARARVSFAQAAQARRIATQIRKKINPPHNGAVFWSGTSPNAHGQKVSVLDDARRFAKAHGKETLEDHLDKNKIHIPETSQNPQAHRLWTIASKAFAQRAKGDVHAILGAAVRPQSVYNIHEKPTLMNNPHVTRLTEHQIPHGGSTVVKGHKRR